MNAADFGLSTLELKHAPYTPITRDELAGANAGKVAVVTGAGRGIGRAIALGLAYSGASVALLDLLESDLQETQSLCTAAGASAKSFVCDVTSPTAVADTFTSIASSLGPVSILVNNAGVFFGERSSDPFDRFWRAIEINFKGTMLCTYQVLAGMRERKEGCIVNIASRAATVDYPGGLSYSASKAAVARATATLQEEFEEEGLGEMLCAYALHPGGVWGAMAAGAPEEVQREMRPMFKDGPELCGQTATWLATGRGKELRGRYLDCRQDVGLLSRMGRETLRKHRLNTLTVNFLSGYENEP